MDFLNRVAKGLAAARSVVGSDEIGPKTVLACEDGKTRINIEPRRRRPDGPVFVRVATPIGDGWAQLDLSPHDARALGEALIAFADERAALEARPLPRITDQTSED